MLTTVDAATNRWLRRLAGGACVALLALFAAPASAQTSVRLERVWTHDAGGQARAEIVACDAAAGELLVTNSAEYCVTRLDLRSGCKLGRYSVARFGAPTSVAASRGLVAIAVPAHVKTDHGRVVLFHSSPGRAQRQTLARRFRTGPLAVIPVGPLPDMVTFTPDGRTLLVANEAEPSDDYLVDPAGSIGVIDLGRGPRQAAVRQADFTAFNAVRRELADYGVQLVAPNGEVADGLATVAQDLEPEYITVAPDGRIAWITLQENNAVAVLDVERAYVSHIIGLGLKDHSRARNGLALGSDDPTSDNAPLATSRPWPVWGMYQPDGIASFVVDGKTYLVTANEGDQRPYAGFSDFARVADLTLDGSLLDDHPDLQAEDQLGPLMVSRIAGDTDGDGDVDRLLAFGARSMSVWTTDGRLVYDSGALLERTIAERLPEWRHVDAQMRAALIKRSFEKGPEPEGVVVGRVGESTYAFVGLERTSAIALFDVTRPRETTLVDVIPLGTGNLGPEGLAFIPAAQSPFGDPLLAVACEATGTTVLYRVQATR